MKLLAIESSAEYCSLALWAGGHASHRGRHAPREHASLLLPWTEELLAESSMQLGDLDALAFSRGPGSFTSLRIGIGVVQGLAWGAGLPVIPLSSLQITAQAAEAGEGKDMLVCMDARMNEVYCAKYRPSPRGIMELVGAESVLSPEDAADLGDRDCLAVGNGFDRYRALTEVAESMAGCLPDAWPDARAMKVLVQDWLENNDPLPAEQAQPVYIRDKVAEKSS